MLAAGPGGLEGAGTRTAATMAELQTAEGRAAASAIAAEHAKVASEHAKVSSQRAQVAAKAASTSTLAMAKVMDEQATGLVASLTALLNPPPPTPAPATPPPVPVPAAPVEPVPPPPAATAEAPKSRGWFSRRS